MTRNEKIKLMLDEHVRLVLSDPERQESFLNSLSKYRGEDEMLDIYEMLPSGFVQCKPVLSGLLSEPHRHYHNQDHINYMWTRYLKDFARGGIEDQSMALAILYHDSVYDPTRKDNEYRSTCLFLEHAYYADMINERAFAWIPSAIMMTANHPAKAEKGSLTSILLDLDLFALSDEAVMSSNTTKIRSEFSHVSDVDWVKGRSAWLASMLDFEYINYDRTVTEKARSLIRHELDTLSNKEK